MIKTINDIFGPKYSELLEISRPSNDHPEDNNPSNDRNIVLASAKLVNILILIILYVENL